MTKYTEQHNPFTIEHSNFEERQKESANIMVKFPSKRPIIIYSNDKQLNAPEKFKFLVPEDQTIAMFQNVIRKQIKLKPEQSIWIYVKDSKMLPVASTISDAYKDYANEDGYLYICYVGENVFGNNDAELN